jgi:hypothetical protein
MKKLSKIDESVWADMHKRSNGEQVKKEDDVNLFDPEQLYEYTNSNYKDKVEYVNFMEGQNTKHVNVEIVMGLEVSINYSNDKIYNILIDLLDNVGIETVVIADNFNIEKINSTTFRIKEKDGSISNKTFLNLVNFILHNIDIVDIKESVWSDMHKRSNGEQERKEDSFNPEYIDFGPDTTVYWAQDALELNGETEFNFEDVENYNNNGWRLPTVKEVEQVDFAKRDKRINWYREDDGIGYTHLHFNEGTLKIKDEDTYATSHLTLWTKDRHEKWKHDAYVYGFHNYKFDIYSSSFSINKHYAFLVKDK